MSMNEVSGNEAMEPTTQAWKTPTCYHFPVPDADRAGDSRASAESRTCRRKARLSKHTNKVSHSFTKNRWLTSWSSSLTKLTFRPTKEMPDCFAISLTFGIELWFVLPFSGLPNTCLPVPFDHQLLVGTTLLLRLRLMLMPVAGWMDGCLLIEVWGPMKVTSPHQWVAPVTAPSSLTANMNSCAKCSSVWVRFSLLGIYGTSERYAASRLTQMASPLLLSLQVQPLLDLPHSLDWLRPLLASKENEACFPWTSLPSSLAASSLAKSANASDHTLTRRGECLFSCGVYAPFSD